MTEVIELPFVRNDSNAPLLDLLAYFRSEDLASDKAEIETWATSAPVALARLEEFVALDAFLYLACTNQADIEPNVFANVQDACKLIADMIRTISSANPKDPGEAISKSGNASLTAQRVRVALFPYSHPAPGQAASLVEGLASAQAFVAQASTALRDATLALEQARAASTLQAENGLVATFGEKAGQHRAASRNWLAGTGAAGAVFFILALILLGVVRLSWVHLPDYTGETETSALVAASSLKIAMLGSLGYAVFFCARTYRVNRHLQTVYELRASVVTTAQQLAAAATSDDERATIIVSMVSSVFPIGDTGFVANDSTADVGFLTSLLASQVRGVAKP